MSWQSGAVRYVSIGEKSARFRDLTLPFTTEGEPVESVIWLPNGGGKSSLMSLKSAVVLPNSRDFTGAGREDGEKRPRRLDDYVGSGDTSHTVIEWTRDDTTSLFGARHQLLTGAVYEWPDRHRPALDQNATLNKLWWSAVPLPGVLDLDTLPVRDGRLLTLSQFRDRIRALNGVHPELQVQVAATQRQWEEQLAALGIDTALYRYQARMNTSEGGIAKVFNFNSVRDFIDLVVDVVAAPEQAADCGDIVNVHAKNLFQRPTLLTERDFLGEASQLLDELDTAHQIVHSAIAERDLAKTSAGKLRLALAAAVRQHEALAAVQTSKGETFQQRASAARTERGRVDAVRYELLALAAQAEHHDAERALQDARDAQAAAREDHSAWAAAAPLAEAARHAATADELREQLKPERAERQQLCERTDAYALAARELLAEQAHQLDEQATQAQELAAAAVARQEVLTRRQRELQRERDEATCAQADARAFVAAHERDLADAVRRGHLSAGQDPQTALGERTEAAEHAAAEAREQGDAELHHRARAQEHAKAASDATLEHRSLAGDAQTAVEAEQELAGTHDALAHHPRLSELAELTDTDSLDVWGEAARLRRRLEDAAQRNEADALRTAVDSAEDERLLGALEATGLLPAPAAALAAVDALDVAGVTAQTAWSVLARDYPGGVGAQVAAYRPDMAAALVVQDDTTRGRALACLASSPTLALIPLVTAAELDAATGSSGTALGDTASTAAAVPLPVVPLHAGLHTSEAAAEEGSRLRSIGQSRQQDRHTYTQRATADRDLLATLETFLASYPDAESLPRAVRARERAQHAAERKLEEVTAHTERETAELDLAGTARDLAAAAAQDAERHRAAVTALGKLAETEASLAEQRAIIETTTAHLDTLTTEGETIEQDLVEARDAQSVADRERDRRAEAATTARSARSGLTVLDPNAAPAEAQVAAARENGLTACLAAHATLSEQWRAAASGSALEAALTAAERSCADAQHRADAILGELAEGPTRDAVTALARTRAAGHDPQTCSQHASTARAALEAAIRAETKAEGALTSAKAVLEAAIKDRDRGRATDPVTFTTAVDARVRAGEYAARSSDLIAEETDLNHRRDDAFDRAEQERKLAADLNYLAGQLPLPPARGNDVGEDGDDIEAFAGDLDEARTRVPSALTLLTTTEEELAAAREQRAGYSAQALKLAGNRTYQNLTLTLRDRLGDAEPDRLGAKAAEYAQEARTRLANVEGLLSQIAANEQTVSTLVATHVRQLLTSIQAANRASVLPAGLGDLSGKRFIHLRFTDPSPDELASRVKQEILALLDQAKGETKSLPSGESILRRCVHAAVGVKGFRVDVLKPNEHMIEQRVPVVDVARFSDGEKLTTCVLLFCAFARMRQTGRSGGATGTLMLDNPFGRASNAQLVALQLAVAKAQRVHLVYATGLEDMGALLQFRRLIRLRNRKPVGSTDGHVQLEDAGGSSRVGEVSGVSVARPSAPVPPGLDVVSAP